MGDLRRRLTSHGYFRRALVPAWRWAAMSLRRSRRRYRVEPDPLKETPVGTVVAGLSMSLDGFIAHLDDGVGYLFDWYDSGEVEVGGRATT
jgi:hypothetical protein